MTSFLLSVVATFGKNQSRNATVRVLADRQTRCDRESEFIICPMLYAIAMGQINRRMIALYYCNKIRITIRSPGTVHTFAKGW